LHFYSQLECKDKEKRKNKEYIKNKRKKGPADASRTFSWVTKCLSKTVLQFTPKG